MQKILKIIGVALFPVVSIFSLGFCEDITITTYYPSPYGSYDKLTTTGDTYLATSSGSKVGIGTTAPRTRLELGNDGAILAVGTYGSGWTEPNLGAGTRMLWYPRKAAFRAGYVVGTEWDNANIGIYSTAMGFDTTASGYNSTAMGGSTTASGNASTAMGFETTASGNVSTAMGGITTASGANSIAMGKWVTAGSAAYTIVLGQGVSGLNSLVNNIASSLMVGFNSTIPTLFVGPSAGVGTTGNVGIGTTSPDEKLHVKQGSTATYIKVGAGIEGLLPYRDAGIKLAHDNLTRWSIYKYDSPAASDFRIAKYNDAGVFLEDVLSIKRSNGNVGIGTTNPGVKLDVNGTIQATGYNASGGTAGATGSLSVVTDVTINFVTKRYTVTRKTIFYKDGLITGIN